MEGKVIYQLLVVGDEDLAAIIGRLAALQPTGIDINCGCGAWDIREVGGGTDLFEDRERLQAVLMAARRAWPGLLTVKLRLGRHHADWRERFHDRLKVIEDAGVDGVTLHPRFAEQHHRRSARHELFGWAAGLTRLPVIANGDITGPAVLARHPEHFEHAAGIMVGRMAAAQPWIFAAWGRPDLRVDPLEVWTRYVGYLLEDFTPRQALVPLRRFAKYYAQNFVFGHTFFSPLRFAPDVETLNGRAVAFLSGSPEMNPEPSVCGI